MNGALNSQGYTQAAWWNRIPVEASAQQKPDIVVIMGDDLAGGGTS